MKNGLQELINIGFKKVGKWYLDNNELKIDIESEAKSKNILYCFVIDKIPVYVGKTIRTLKERIYGYQKPSRTQATNTKNNNNIKNAIRANKEVFLYVLPDNGLLHFGKFHLNLAAGLEDSIIKKLNPEWSGQESKKLHKFN